MTQLARAAAALDENEVRRWCGPGIFARADRLQRAGHVLSPAMEGLTLNAGVRGTWRRIDHVVVQVTPGGLTATCSCGMPRTCRHAVALVLHWLRDRESFGREEAPAEPHEYDATLPRTAATDETPLEELARLLENNLMPRLRELARFHRIPAGSRTKADLAAALVPVLAAPDNVDAALGQLSPEERLALEAVYLLGAAGAPTDLTCDAGYQRLGGVGEAPLDTLLARGLLAPAERLGNGYRYQVPRVVAARLPTLTEPRGLEQPFPGAKVTGSGDGAAGPRLDFGGLVLILAAELEGSGLTRRQPTPEELQLATIVPVGWRVDPRDLEGESARDIYYRPRQYGLLPEASWVLPEDLKRLVDRTGLSPARVTFALHVMADLGVLRGDPRRVLDRARLAALLSLPAEARLDAWYRAWLGLRGWTEFTMLAGESGPLQVKLNLPSHIGVRLLLPEAALARGFVARVIGRMEPDRWYGFEPFLAWLVRVAPGLLQPSPYGVMDGHALVGTHTTPAVSRSSAGMNLEFLRGAWLKALLIGPLAWLGVVDIAQRTTASLSFRVRPEAGRLSGREMPESAISDAGGLVVYSDLTVLASARGSNLDAHTLLGRAGELIETTPAGLRYRLTAERLRDLFETGVSGPELLRFLAERGGTALPPEVSATISHWWENYGNIRLYDSLSLVELGDDYLLPGLLTSPVLAGAVVHALSPRLIAVDPRALDPVLEELARLGYTPRVVEE